LRLPIVLLFISILGGGALVWLGRVEDPGSIFSEPSPRDGAPAPDFALTDLNGDTHALEAYRGRPVIINFWATWCPPCRSEMPDLQEVYEKYQDDGLVLLAVNQAETPATVGEFVDELGLTFPILMDNNLSVSQGLYEVEAYPTTYFIDRDGRIQEVALSGPLSKSYVESQVLRMLP
jgi:peroxiredoxin